MLNLLNDEGLDLLFRNARTHNAWQNRTVSDEQLERIYDLMKMGPTAFNCLPTRLVFVTSSEAKERLRPALVEGNVEKTMAAPATVIVAYDTRFFDYLPEMFPAFDAKPLYEGDAEFARQSAVRNTGLQGGYLIMAARSLGLDVGPMSGFDNGMVDDIFFLDGRYKSDFLANIGYGDETGLYPRGPRLAFDQVCKII